MVFLGAETTHGPGDPVRTIRIDGEAVQGPYQQAGDDEPLGGLECLHKGPSYTGVVGGDELDGAVDYIEGEEGEAVSQAAVLTADIEGYGDGEDYG